MTAIPRVEESDAVVAAGWPHEKPSQRQDWHGRRLTRRRSRPGRAAHSRRAPRSSPRTRARRCPTPRPSPGPPPRAAPHTRDRRGCVTSAPARSAGSSGSTSSPFSPCLTTSGMPARLPPTIARPRHAASIATRGRPSERDGSASTHASSIAAATPSGVRWSTHSTRPPNSPTARRASDPRLPRPTIRNVASGRRRRRRARRRPACRTP